MPTVKVKVTSQKVPAKACILSVPLAELELQAAEGKEPAKFSILAISGKPLGPHWYWGNLSVDLAGLKGKERVPVLLQHDVEQRVGFSDSRKVVDGKGLV